MNVPDDTQLLERLLVGDQKAYKELINSYHGAMRAVAYSIVGERNADEAVQDAWLSVAQSLDGFQRRSSLKTWLLTITANAAKQWYKKNRREILMDDLNALPNNISEDRLSASNGYWLTAPLGWHHDTPEALLTERELLECLDRTLLNLPDLQRSVLLLREWQGHELDDICKMLDISDSNARVLLHRAKLKVFAIFEDFERMGEK